MNRGMVKEQTFYSCSMVSGVPSEHLWCDFRLDLFRYHHRHGGYLRLFYKDGCTWYGIVLRLHLRPAPPRHRGSLEIPESRRGGPCTSCDSEGPTLVPTRLRPQSTGVWEPGYYTGRSRSFFVVDVL